MKPRKSSLRVLRQTLCWVSLLASGNALGHGGVVLEGDLCVIQVGFYQAHFTVFQPRTQGHEQFCEDLPDLGESVFVLEYLHDGLEQMSVDFRIVRNVTGMGRFTAWEDVQAIPDLDAVTEFYQPPVREPDVFAILHEFREAGDFIGIVTARSADSDTSYAAVFPFEVGLFGINYLAIAFAIVALGLLSVAGLHLRNVRVRGRGPSQAAAALLITLTVAQPDTAHAEVPRYSANSRDGGFQVVAWSRLDPLRINTLHTWTIELTDTAGQPLTGAAIEITGGMPDHDHGLPTSPRVTAEPSPGVYTLQGMKFHMHGAWELTVEVRSGQAVDSATLHFEL